MPPQSAANTPVELWQKLLKGPLTDIKIACAELGDSENLSFAINIETQILQRFGRDKMSEMAGAGAAGGGGMSPEMMMGGQTGMPQGPAMGFNPGGAQPPVQNQGPPVDEMRRVLSMGR